MSEYAGGTFERPLTEDERHADLARLTEVIYAATNLLDWSDAEKVAEAVLRNIDLGQRADGPRSTSHVVPQGRSEADCLTPQPTAVGVHIDGTGGAGTMEP